MADEKQGALSGLKSAWGNPKARKGILITAGIGGAVLLVTGLSMRGGGNQQGAVPTAATVAAPPLVRSDVAAEVTPQYQEMVRTRDAQRAQDASKSQLDMALPQVAGLTAIKETPVAPARPASAVAVVAPQQAVTAAPAAPVQTQAQLDQQVRASPAYAVAGAFLTSAAQSTNYAKSAPFQIIRAPESKGVTQGGQQGQQGQQGQYPGANAGQQGGQGQVGAPVTPASVLIRAGTAVFATMDTAINSDFSGPVVATIRQGPYANARLIGSKSLEYDSVVVRFNTISMPNGGPAIPVNAYAINLGDVSKFGTTGLEGDINYHAFTRYFLPAVLAFTQTYGYAASVQGTQTSTTTTATTQSTTPLSSKDRMVVALGGAVAPIAADIAQRSTRPVTVTMPANSEVGVLFSADVTDKTQEKAERQAAQGINAGYDTGVAAPQTARSAVTPTPNAQLQGSAPRQFGSTGALTPTYTAPYGAPGGVYSGVQQSSAIQVRSAPPVGLD